MIVQTRGFLSAFLGVSLGVLPIACKRKPAPQTEELPIQAPQASNPPAAEPAPAEPREETPEIPKIPTEFVDKEAGPMTLLWDFTKQVPDRKPDATALPDPVKTGAEQELQEYWDCKDSIDVSDCIAGAFSAPDAKELLFLVQQSNESGGRNFMFNWAFVLVNGDHYTLFKDTGGVNFLRTIRMPSGLDFVLSKCGAVGQGVVEENAGFYAFKNNALSSSDLGLVYTDLSGMGKEIGFASRLEVKTLPGDTFQIRRTHFKQRGSGPYKSLGIHREDILSVE
jgi:hypothetical protein